jgi:hypothetical protein
VLTDAIVDPRKENMRADVGCPRQTKKDFKVAVEVAAGLKVVGLVQRRTPRVLIMALACSGSTASR